MSQRARPSQVPTSSPSAITSRIAAKYVDGWTLTRLVRSRIATTPIAMGISENVARPSGERSLGGLGGLALGGAGGGGGVGAPSV
jgi:hypothetical protein